MVIEVTPANCVIALILLGVWAASFWLDGRRQGRKEGFRTAQKRFR